MNFYELFNLCATFLRKGSQLTKIYFLGATLRKNFGSGRSLQSLFHFVSQRIFAATLRANSDLRFKILDFPNNQINESTNQPIGYLNLTFDL